MAHVMEPDFNSPELSQDLRRSMELIKSQAEQEKKTVEKIKSEHDAQELNQREQQRVKALREIAQQRVLVAFNRFNSCLSEQRATPESVSRVVDVMGAIAKAAEVIDPQEPAHESYYKNIASVLMSLMRIKGDHLDSVLQTSMALVFHEYAEVVDSFLVTPYLTHARKKGGAGSVEHRVKEITHQSADESEIIKAKNREKVVDVLHEISQEPEYSIETLTRLHQENNRGIVPDEFSQLRTSSDVTFQKRVGTTPEHVQQAVQEIMDRANKLRAKKQAGMSNFSYRIAAAKLHNDLLDIHPFSDRNGSTALLFLELLAMEAEYEPKKERGKDYYRQVMDILDNNLVAVAVVGYEQVKIANLYGYYSSESFKTTKTTLPIGHEGADVTLPIEDLQRLKLLALKRTHEERKKTDTAKESKKSWWRFWKKAD